MRTSVVIGQIPVGWDIDRNLAAIERVLAATHPGDLVVLPEGALSGYDLDLTPLRGLDPAAVAHAVDTVADLARRRSVHLFCGSLTADDGAWWNAVHYLRPEGGRWTYRKVNLAMNERGLLRAGAELPVVEVRRTDGAFTAGVQLCREIRFPEQWQLLARSGADVLIFPTNAANPDEPAGVWRSHLVSRAAENQRFVLAANAAHPAQHCPSMVVSPRGVVLAELPAGADDLIRVTIDLGEVSDWYLGQQRHDLVSLHHHGGPTVG